ncbi:LOW QUALITY PROTEIN: serine-rich adhesin for platelets-like [Eriocheir sinensis]|uniref:LOW QUALITY PROTEIN: serine-rich adhesin for platelets-like n=1 Tax=Eriocheir sinensis TaxID=95602 RepID=UPI0021C59EDA|nr:LOW QUALITY PROTEIN: serine-rich adhesin for platelets-like [Eriocheir sinensis]
MEVLSPSKRHAAVLEMVSDEEEEEGAQESEQEEGEICSEDEEEGAMEGEVPCPVFSNYSANATNSLPAYAPHFSFPDHRPNKTPSLATVASEVVIYDDKGRTAIFTSPKKPRISSYPRRGEASRQHARELPRRKEKEGERSRRHHSSSSLQTASEKWPKASWRSAMESRGAGPPQEGHVRPYRAKTKDVSGVRGGHRARKGRPPSPDSSSRSSSCSSCSSSSSSSLISCSPSEEENDVSTVSPCKGRGKENRRCGPAGKSHDRPHSQEYGCDPPPPAKESSKPLPQPPSHRPKHSGSQHGSSHHRPPATYSKGPRRRPSTHHNSRRSPKESTAGKAAHQQHQRTHQKPPKARPSERKDSSKVDKPVKEAESVPTIVKGQNRLPRGSLGEMLLSRPKAASTHPTPGLQDIPRPPGEDPKTPTSPAKPEMQQGEEKVVQEVILDSHTSSEGAENLTLDQEDDEELQLRLIAIQSSLRLLTDMQREGQTQEEAGIGEESCHTSSPLKKTGMKDEPQQEILNDLSVLKESRTPPVKDAGGQGSHTSPSRAGRAVEADAAVVQISDDISISSSSASEICSENLATNTSYLEEGGGGKGAEDSRRRGKERSDVDQDPVDMEICDSSGEEEGGQAMVVQDSPLSPEPGQDTGKAAPGEGPAGVSSSNFQIPVEWAYMMPPPPPPDQPANDLHNINSWCFDQNMYLQAMQVAPQDEQQQQQQGQAEAGQGTEWLAPAQPHASTPWPGPFMEAYDNNTLPQDTSSPLSLPMGLPPDQQQDQHQQQHPPEYAFSEPALPQHTSPPGQGSDLKDAPAEQYQAFMSAVLQQQQQQPSPKGRVPAAPAFTECPQRNLIMVPLSGSHQPTAAAAAKASKKVKAKVKKMRTKKRLRKKQVLQECSNSGSQQQMTSSSTGAAGAATAVEEEDEELLRAKLLIDMSRKKEQRLQGATTTTTPPTASTNAAPSASFPAPVNRTTTTAKEGQEGRASPQTLPQPSEALVPPRSLRVVKGHDGRPRSGESSPTHSFKGESRKGLSDIGGWGLDPKGSKFNYHSSTQHDFPLSGGSSSSLDITKVKFPTIQPIIISLQSDSDDSDEEGEGRGEGPSAEPMSHSIDILLKSMRNANMASTSKEVDPAIPKPGPSTRSTSPAAPSSPATKPREVADSTPQVSHTTDSAVEADAAVVQISDDISISSSSASEICSENLATNTSYLEEGGGGKGAEDSRRRGKERSDVDQDPVDMEICDSSGEEEGGQAMVVQDSPLSPEPGQDTGKAAPGEGPAGVSSSNFQIPVEWAYMMPPPPPPDQPANDLHNINSWCFDQNMYLQAMQVAPQDEQQQQQQGQAEAGQGTEWLAPAQPHASTPWPGPFMEAYDNNTLPQDTSSPLSLPMGLPPDQQQDQHQQQHPPEYAFSEPALPQHTSPPGQGSDLKDAPAEQYQAFMSAVLQQQQQQPSPKGRVPAAPAFTECPQRNLIMVPLSGSHQPTAAAAAKASKKVKAKVKKMRTKKRLRKKQVLQECSNSGSQQQMTSSSTGAAGAATAVEEEDEELLRAKLLIDMSRKKEQRLQGATTTTTPPTASTNAAPSASFPAPVNRTTTTAKEGQEGRASPQTLPQPSEALVPPRSLRVVKGHDGRPRSGESSPTHSFKGESRKGLSDIGGWGLDPKGSKFNYHSSTQHDFPLSGGSSSSLDITKVKFPTIQPIIISLQSDSDDSDEEGEGRGGPSAEPMSHSIDILLKSMRNANMASTSKEVDPAIPKPGPSTRSTSPAAPSSPATKPREVADSTPQAVRHLSRHQQLEYRWLKEQLRKKEMLQRRKMLQRPLRAKLQPKLPPPPPPLAPTSPDIAQSSSQSSVGSPVHTDPSRLSSGSEGSPSTRAVTWKDIGLLQIQVSNDAALDLSSEGTDPGDRVREALDDSSASASAVEDDDEETLRMMALRTQKSKKSETQCRRVVVEGRVSENEGDTEAKDGEEEVSMETSSEEHLDEGLRGEWMVLDEVREEGTEVGEEELCARPPGSSADELKCGEGTETSDDEEAVIRYPSHALRKENQNTEQQVPRTTDEERTKEQTNKTNGKEAQIREGEAAQNTASATASSPSTVTPDQPASEGRSASQSDTDTKQQDPPVMPGVRQVSEPSCNKIIEEVIRRIENKTRVVRGEASRESSPVEVNRSSVPSQGSTKKQVSSQLPSKKETKTKLTSATQKLINLTPVTASHSGERESTLVKSSHSTTTSTTTTTSSVSLAGTVSRGAAGALNQSRAVVSNQNGGGGGVPQRTVLPSGTMQKVRRVQMVRPQSNTDSAGKDSASAAPTTSVTTAARAQDTDNPTKAQLKRVENEYKEKKSGINKMIVQLGQLLKEVSEEQQQQQEFKKSISELQTKLREMESQYEGKSSALQTKLKLIGHIQVQYRSERQVLRRLEHHGETLGKQVYGTGFSFKSLPVSPRSKVKDVSTKKTLASSIYALQQQVRDLTNKQKNSLKTSPNKATEAGVLRKQNTENNGLKTPPTNTTEAGMLRKQSTGNSGFKTPPANTTEAGVLRKQSIGNSGFKTPPANTTEAGVLRKQSTGNNGFKTPPANTTETGVLRKQNTADNLKTPPANTTETGVLKKQNTADNLKTPPANTTEAGVLRKQNTANNLKTPPANTTGRQNTADNFKTPPANTTERGVVRKQNTVDTTTETTPTTTTNSTIKTTSTTTTKQGEPERSTTKTLNLDAKNGTTVALEKVTVEASVKSATALHVQGVPSGAPHSRPPANTQGKDGGAKVARVQMPKEDQPSAVPERDGARLASRPTSAATNGAKEEDKLDEMKALCPHDLLGRCNDSSCQYQHLPAVRTAPQAQNSPSSSKEPRLSSRDDEPQTTTSTTIKQGKVVGRAGAKQVKVTSGSAVPSERSSEEVKSQLLPDTHVSEQQHQTQTVVENGTATTALEDSDTQPTSRTAAPTTEQTGTPNTTDTEMQASTPTDTHTTSQTAAPTTEQTGTPNTTTTDSEMQGRTPTDSHATSQTSAPTTEEQTGTPNTTTTTVTEMQQAPTDTPDTTDTRPYATQHQTDTDIKTTDEQTERPQAGTSVGNLTEATITDTDVESQTPTEPQETQTGTETSVQGWQTDEAASVEALNAAVTEASTAQPETPTCTRETENTESGTNEDAASLQTGTTSGSTETQTGAEDTEIDTETSASVSRELSDSSTTITESEGREWLPSDVESQASTTSSSDCLPLKHQPPKPSSRPAKRRASCRKSRESITEDAAPSQDLQSEGDTVNELQKTRGTRKSLRVKAKASPKGTPPPKKGAKPTTPGKGQKRKSESLSKHPSSKKRHATKP